MRTRSLIPETLKILPASLKFKEIAVTHEYARILDSEKFCSVKGGDEAKIDTIDRAVFKVLASKDTMDKLCLEIFFAAI